MPAAATGYSPILCTVAACNTAYPVLDDKFDTGAG
jgi:hypothetical protein